MLIPRIDVNQRVRIVPAAIRYHRAGNWTWGVATINNVDHCTFACPSRREAQKMAFEYGSLFKVLEWKEHEPIFRSQGIDQPQLQIQGEGI